MGLLNMLKKILLLSSVLILAINCGGKGGGGSNSGSGTQSSSSGSDSGLTASEELPSGEGVPVVTPRDTSPDLVPEGFDPTGGTPTKTPIPLVPSREGGPLPEDVTPGPTPFGIPIDPAPRTSPTIPPPTKGPAPVKMVPLTLEGQVESPVPTFKTPEVIYGSTVVCGNVTIAPGSISVSQAATLPKIEPVILTNNGTSAVGVSTTKSYSSAVASGRITNNFSDIMTLGSLETKAFSVTFNPAVTGTSSLTSATGSLLILEVRWNCGTAPVSTLYSIY